MNPMPAVALAALLAVGPAWSAVPDAAYSTELAQWRDKADKSLTRERGWLSIVSRDELAPGSYTIGSAPDNKIVLPKGLAPAHLGVVIAGNDKARLELAKGHLRVTSQNPDLGEAKEEVPVEYDGDALKIGFNARYILDVLAVLRSKDVKLELADDLSPGVVKGGDEVDQGFTAVVMPMRI